jgi:hypothetical protein
MTAYFQSSGEARRRRFRERRRDPLGEGHLCTWRQLVIKVAAEVVVVSVRRIVVRLPASWSHQGWYRRVCQRLRGSAVALPSG